MKLNNYSSIKNSVFTTVGKFATCNIEETIVIAGTPRAGTTWLLELLQAQPGYKAIMEPLLHEEARNKYGFDWRTYLDPNEETMVKKDYLEKILSGQLGISPAWHFNKNNRLQQLFEHSTNGKVVVKFCRLNRMLHWFDHNFTVKGMVFIVRHPCAVVASMLKHGGWDRKYLNGNEVREFVEPKSGLPEPLKKVFEPVLDRIQSRTEALATLWCLDHYVPLIQQADSNKFPSWILVPYERLVAKGLDEQNRIASALGIEVTSSMVDQFRKPSSTVHTKLKNPKEQLSKWKVHLTEKQINDIMNIVDETGLNKFYTKDIEPNYEALNSYQNSDFRW